MESNLDGRITAFARAFDTGEFTRAQLAALRAELHLTVIPAAIWNEAHAQLTRAPRDALARARALRALVTRRTDSARASLLLIRALNACGEFRAAVEECNRLAAQLTTVDTAQFRAPVWWQAAYAESWRGNLDSARAFLARARAAKKNQDALGSASCSWIEGRLARDEWRVADAEKSFQDARAKFLASGDGLNAARLTLELGHLYSRTRALDALDVLAGIRAVFEKQNSPLELALCDYFTGQARTNLDQYAPALDDFDRARRAFDELGNLFFSSLCDLDSGFNHLQLDHYAEGLEFTRRARDAFRQMGADAEVSSCEINIGLALLRRNHYDDALARFETALPLALATGRNKKAALCLTNIGWCRLEQGRHADALNLFRHARDIYARENTAYQLAWCDLNIGLAHLNLGQSDTAYQILIPAREFFAAHDHPSDLAECEMYLAQISAARGDNASAENALAHAHALYTELGQPALAASANRLFAQLSGLRGDKSEARARLAECRALFRANDQPVESALCDLVEGELRCAWDEFARAKELLNGARAKLAHSFPDHAWRADYALARMAEKQTRRRAALQHYRNAVRAIADVRAQLVSEQWSNDFFATRQRVYDDALNYAVAQDKPAEALAVIESAKAQIFLARLMRRDWKRADADARRTELKTRETELRYQLAALHDKITPSATPTVRGDESTILAQYQALSAEYENVVAQLQGQQQGLAGAPTLTRFDLAQFRKRANARWGRNWLALDYYLRDDVLTLVSVDSKTLTVESRRLNSFQRNMLERCADPRADMREMIYRQTIRGVRVPSSGVDPLKQIAALLIPARVRRARRLKTLLISPHGLLHHIPFHALKLGEKFLIERFQFVYTPALQAWSQLNVGTDQKPLRRMLACGLDEFGKRARALRYTKRELRGLRALFGKRLTALWQDDARRETVRAWNDSRALQKFDALHFATHAILDPAAPHWSRVWLADEALSVTDILDLALDASLVTLSACSSAAGEVGQGDEIVTLARAFFYAGARALVASLWQVEDDSTAELMTAFYKHLRAGNSIAASLRAAQIELIRRGLQPFHWAPFVVLGNG